MRQLRRVHADDLIHRVTCPVDPSCRVFFPWDDDTLQVNWPPFVAGMQRCSVSSPISGNPCGDRVRRGHLDMPGFG